MKRKYTFFRDDEKNIVVVKEYAEIDEEIQSLLCQEVYDLQKIKKASCDGIDMLVMVLRTNNIYPPYSYAIRIANVIIDMFKLDADESAEIFFDEDKMNARLFADGLNMDIESDEVDDEDSVDVEKLLCDGFNEEGINFDSKIVGVVSSNNETGVNGS